jgi:hypothetical protein
VRIEDGRVRNFVAWLNLPNPNPAPTVGGRSFIPPLRWEPEWALSADGRRFAAVFAEREGPFRVVTINESGDTVFNRQYEAQLIAIPRGVRDSALARRTRTVGITRTLNPDGIVPRSYAPFEGIAVGSDGTVWVQLRATGEGVPWLVLDAAGTPVGEVMAPAAFRPMVVSRGMVWASVTDDVGLQSLVRYRVQSRE